MSFGEQLIDQLQLVAGYFGAYEFSLSDHAVGQFKFPERELLLVISKYDILIMLNKLQKMFQGGASPLQCEVRFDDMVVAMHLISGLLQKYSKVEFFNQIQVRSVYQLFSDAVTANLAKIKQLNCLKAYATLLQNGVFSDKSLSVFHAYFAENDQFFRQGQIIEPTQLFLSSWKQIGSFSPAVYEKIVKPNLLGLLAPGQMRGTNTRKQINLLYDLLTARINDEEVINLILSAKAQDEVDALRQFEKKNLYICLKLM